MVVSFILPFVFLIVVEQNGAVVGVCILHSRLVVLWNNIMWAIEVQVFTGRFDACLSDFMADFLGPF